jgi:hypothetical protein
MSQRARLGVIAAAVVVAIVGFVIASSGGSNSKQTTSRGPVTIVVKGAKPVGGIKPITVKKGQRVRFTVKSDVADEIHVHGYDFHKNVAKNGTVTFDFPAKIDGSFVIELERRSEQIAALKVEP